MIQLSTRRYRTPNTVAVVLTVVIGTWVHAQTIQVQVVAIVVIARSRRPIVAVATSIAGGRRIEVAGLEEVIWESSNLFTSSRIGYIRIIINLVV